MPEREYIWFIEPLDSRTNQVISQELPVQNFSRGLVCEDGKEHNLWECSYILAYALSKSRRALNLNFAVYNREGRGRIRKCDFLVSKPRKKKKQKTAN